MSLHAISILTRPRPRTVVTRQRDDASIDPFRWELENFKIEGRLARRTELTRGFIGNFSKETLDLFPIRPARSCLTARKERGESASVLRDGG